MSKIISFTVGAEKVLLSWNLRVDMPNAEVNVSVKESWPCGEISKYRKNCKGKMRENGKTGRELWWK